MRLSLLFLLLLLISGCSDNGAHSHKQQLYVFGTLVEVVIWTEDEQAAQQEITRLGEQFQQWHLQWHPWQRGGDLAEFNQALAEGETVAIPETVMPLLQRATELSQLSDGLFDPTMGGLVRLWGFSDNLVNPSQPPDAELLAEFIQDAPSLAQLQLEEGLAHSDNPRLQLDFGGFAKGYVVDRAIEQLRKHGFHNAIVNAGGDLRAIGSKDQWPWRIGIRHPREDGLIASLEIDGDESVFTSGDYERFFEYQGRRYHHIIDPRSGYPTQGLSSVTVLHHAADAADAAATALMVAGPQKWRETAKAMGLQHVMVIDAVGVVHMTPSMAERIHFETVSLPEILVETL